MTVEKPNCLHVSRLYSGKNAALNWGNAQDAKEYRLECAFDEPLDEARCGLAWEHIDETGLSWEDVGEEQNWQHLENLSARGVSWICLERQENNWSEWEENGWDWKSFCLAPADLTIYLGPGAEVPAPDQGLSWDSLDNEEHCWNQMETLAHSWNTLRLLESLGLAWAQLDSEDNSWATLEAETKGQAWVHFEKRAATGRCWDSLDSGHLAWDSRDEKDNTWRQFETVAADNKTHRGCKVPLPENKKGAYFGAQCLDENGAHSDALLSARQPIVTRDVLAARAKAGETLFAQVNGTRLRSFDGDEFQLLVDRNFLRRDVRFKRIDDRSCAEPVNELSLPEKLHFTCNKKIDGQAMWDGLVKAEKLEGLRDGHTELVLERTGA